MQDSLVFILAGGKGERLYPLTSERSKPSVPFGGKYRIIDFVINNMINSEFFNLKILTQFKSDSLIRHVSKLNLLNPSIDQNLDIVPAQMRTGEDWYRGTADAIYQNINLINETNPKHTLVFGGDHIYKMNVYQCYLFHKKNHANITISTIPIHKSEAFRFGVLEINEKGRVIGFVEKPKNNPPTIPGRPEYCLASMGNYIFETDFLLKILNEDCKDETSSHDFGKDIIPKIYPQHKVYAYDFSQNKIPNTTEREIGYWRDVGDIDAYYNANMDLCSVEPVFNLYNTKWPIRSVRSHYPPVKFVFENDNGRNGVAYNSIIGEGTIISGSTVRDSVLFQNIFAHSFSVIDKCIIYENVEIGRYAKLKKVICDKDVKIPPKVEIGYDYEKDKKRFYISENGIVVIPKGYNFHAKGNK